MSDPSTVYGNFVLSQGPINYWRFTELVTGTTVVDEVGGNNLTMFDDSIEGNNVGVDNGSAFINTDYNYDYNRGFVLDTPIIPNTELTSGYTHTAWLKLEEPVNDGDSYYVAVIGSEDGKGFEMWMYRDDTTGDIMEFYFYGASSTVDPSYIDLLPEWDTWIHVAHVVESDGTWKMYLNGAEILYGDNAPSTLDWRYVLTDGSYEMMQGRGDEVALFDRPLSATEILDQYDAGADYFGSI